MMKIAWATDIHMDHLEVKHAPRYFGAICATHNVHALVLTGDIAQANSFSKVLLHLQQAFGGPVYFVLGNHDVWGQSFTNAHHKATRLSAKHPAIQWLANKVVLLSETSALVGLDGWYDAQHGNIDTSTCVMNDWLQIKDFSKHWGLKTKPIEQRVEVIVQMCRERCTLEVQAFEPLLMQALAQRHHVLVATHVPPFVDSAMFNEQRALAYGGAEQSYLAWYVNKTLGDLLLQVAAKHPNNQITVLCGHAHTAHTIDVLPNLRVYTGAAKYGVPVVADMLVV